MSEAQQHDGTTIRIGEQKVGSEGKVTIPDHIIGHYGIEPGEPVVAHLLLDDGEVVTINRPLDSRSRFRITKAICDEYGIERGSDLVDIQLEI